MLVSALLTPVCTCSSRFSCVKHNIWEPTMLAQDWRVNTVRMKGSVSPCRCTIDAIWITGSLSASGKIPGKRRLTSGSNFAFAFHQIWSGLKDKKHVTGYSLRAVSYECQRERNTHTFSPCTLDVKAKDSERCDPLPVSLCRVTYQICPSHIHLVLTQGHLKDKNSRRKLMSIVRKAWQNKFYMKELKRRWTADPCSITAYSVMRGEPDLPCLGTENPCPSCFSLHALCTCLWEVQSSSIPPHQCPP